MKYIIIGLGNFGSALSMTMTDMGNEVLGVDCRMEAVQSLRNDITQTVCLDATNQQELEELPLADADTVLVCLGKDVGSSILITALLKKLKVKQLLCRAISKLHQTVLETMQVDGVISPEQETAHRLAVRLEQDRWLNAFPVLGQYDVVEVKAPDAFANHTVAELEIRNRYGLLVLAVVSSKETVNMIGIQQSKKQIESIAEGSTPIRKGDFLLLFGSTVDIRKMLQQTEF